MEVTMTSRATSAFLFAGLALLAVKPTLAQTGPHRLSVRETDHHPDELAGTGWYVDDDNCPGPGSGTINDPFCTIQVGISAAMHGDIVLVMPGTYVENIDFMGKAITVKSSDGPASTIIDGNKSGSVVTFDKLEGKDSVLEGFTITNGSGKTTPYASRAGGGIYCESSSPTIRHNVIKGNAVGGGSFVAGGGFYGLWCHGLTFTNNTVEDNKAVGGTTVQGGGFYCKYGDDLNMTSNVIVRNVSTTSIFSSADGGGVTLIAAHGVAFHNNIVATNGVSAGEAWGSGILLSNVTIDILNTTITSNTTYWAQFGCATQLGYHWSNVTIANSVIWFDQQPNPL
ncbi:MAG: right-handed parallel beta-helix repeat-containing protein, partial [Planctomycetota bacterium]